MISTLFVLLVVAFIARMVLTSTAGRGRPELSAQYEAEVARLREEVDVLNGEVRRLSEAHSFMLRLLTDGKSAGEQPAEGPPAPGTDNEETA